MNFLVQRNNNWYRNNINKVCHVQKDNNDPFGIALIHNNAKYMPRILR